MIKILILSANPKNTEKLRLDEEVREIQAGLERSRHREQFEIITKWAVRVDDLRRALLDIEPQIVHFSGHGAASHGLALENSLGQMQLVSTEALARLFKLLKSRVECVLLNACYSEVQAEAIHQHIDYVVSMNQVIGDRAAIKFTVGFYDALGAGRSIEDAFEFGCTAIELEGILESLTPVLKSRKNVTPSTDQRVRFEANAIPSSKSGMNYTQLESFLAAKQWLQADQETTSSLLRVSGREREGWLRAEDIEKLSRQDLDAIDRLWLKYSNGQFGFSVQKHIWQTVRVSNPKDYVLALMIGKQTVADVETCLLFCSRVGWFASDSWVDYEKLSFSEDAPKGHLPVMVFFEPVWKVNLLGIYQVHSAILTVSWWKLCVYFFSRIEIC